MTALLQGYKKIFIFGVLLVGLLLLVACDSDGNLIIKIPATPPDFKISTTYSADEPKLIVQVDELNITGLEKLEYRLERFSDQCNDSDKVYTGVVPKPLESTSFDIATEAYGAFKLSVTATYGAIWFQDPVKTVLPSKPNLEDLPDSAEGLVYIEIIDGHVQNMASQIHLDLDTDPLDAPESNNFEYEDNFRVNLDGLKFADGIQNGQGRKHRVVTAINSTGTKDRKWCSAQGRDLIGKSGVDLLLNGYDAYDGSHDPPNNGEHFATQFSEDLPANLGLVLKPGTTNGQRAPFIYFNLTVYKAVDGSNVFDTDANGNFVKLLRGAELFSKDFIVQDCAAGVSDLSEVKLDCFIDNDFPR